MPRLFSPPLARPLPMYEWGGKVEGRDAEYEDHEEYTWKEEESIRKINNKEIVEVNKWRFQI